VAERPVVRIDGQLDTAAEFTRITGAFQLSTGQLVVADARLRAVRVFGPDGAFQRDLGRAGAGPGEFMGVALLPPVGDTILVWDGRQKRLSRYLPDGRVAGTLRVLSSGTERPIFVVARLTSGRWLVATSYAPSVMRPGGTFADSIHIGTIPATGTGPIAWIGWFPGTTFFVWKPNARSDHGESVGVAQFAAATQVLAAGNDVIVASGGTNEVTVLDQAGQRLGRFQLPGERRPIPESARSRAREAAVAQGQSDQYRAFTDASFDRSALPAVAPAFGAALWYRGELWLQLFDADPSARRRYRILSLNGSVRGEFAFPPRSHLLDVGHDFAWIAVADDDGVVRLEKYAVRR
jgi:hypothetical protein